MAKNNYQYEKRQRDLAKKKKKEEKKQKKLERHKDSPENEENPEEFTGETTDGEDIPLE